MPAGSGIVYSDSSVTPDADGTLIVTITFDVKGNMGFDWGSSYSNRAFLTQSGSTTNGDEYPIGNIRAPKTIRAVFSVSGGVACEIGLYGTIGGAVSANWWNVKITAELIKR